MEVAMNRIILTCFCLGLATLFFGCNHAHAQVSATPATNSPIPIVSPFTPSTIPGLAGVTAITTPVLNYLLPNTNALQATRWTFFGCYTKASGLPKTSSSNVGFSAGAVYYVNSVVGTQIRCQYLDTGTGTGANAILLPNGEITLSSAYHPLGSLTWLTIRPILEMGAAADLKGNLFAIVGAGTELDLYTTTNAAAAFQRASVFYGKEQWQGNGDKFTTTQIGAAFNWNLEALQKKIGKIFGK
jgi:hypothetical protein